MADLRLHRTGATLRGLIEFAARSEVGNVRASWFAPSAETVEGGYSLQVQEQSVALVGSVDNEAIEAQSLRALEKLNLRYTRATDRGVARLREHLPNCEIEQ